MTRTWTGLLCLALATTTVSCSSASKSADSADSGIPGSTGDADADTDTDTDTDTDGSALLQVDPPSIDFGSVALGSTASEVVTIENGGDADLEVTGLTLAEGAEFALTAAASLEGTVLAPADQLELTVSYTAASSMGDADLLTIETTGGTAEVDLVGETDRSAYEVYVQLDWDVNDSDLDLHVATDGAEPFVLPDDCSYCNPAPDWGTTGAEANPRVVLDNRVGYGPEVIHVETGATGATGDYTVRVHYFDDKGGGDAAATVRVWVAGVLAWEGTETLEGRDMWEVGVLDSTTGSFTATGTSPERWTGRTTCYTPE